MVMAVPIGGEGAGRVDGGQSTEPGVQQDKFFLRSGVGEGVDPGSLGPMKAVTHPFHMGLLPPKAVRGHVLLEGGT